MKDVSPETLSKGRPKARSGDRDEPSDPPHKRVIRMITGGPIAARGHPLRKDEYLLYGFARKSSPPSRNDLTSLDVGDRAYPKDMHAKIPGSDVPSAYNVILGRPTLNAFQAIIFMYHIKIKFPTPGGVGEVQGDPFQSQKCYIEAIRKGQKRRMDEALKEPPSCKREKDDELDEEPKTGRGTPPKVQPVEELLNIELIPRDPKKTTRIGSRMNDPTQKEVIQCLQHNIDVFAWTPQDLEGIDPKFITHHLNIYPY
ncbi:UNVERIFIED_CONTAM: hypothetical protein Sradi_5754700 [Sesamum radiatum]|uniref:Reverse transcriptase domain-containing protein n=1 Tax=Sesamum radiatum TaxID=300843 RepID=A0AAW2L4N2_SESRA